MLFHNRLARHALKKLARVFLRDVVMLACNKYFIVKSDAFLLQNNAFKRSSSAAADAHHLCHRSHYHFRTKFSSSASTLNF